MVLTSRDFVVYYFINLQGKVKILTGGKARKLPIGGRCGEVPEPMEQQYTQTYRMVWCALAAQVQMEEDERLFMPEESLRVF